MEIHNPGHAPVALDLTLTVSIPQLFHLALAEVAFEEATNGDYQDALFLIENVRTVTD